MYIKHYRELLSIDFYGHWELGRVLVESIQKKIRNIFFFFFFIKIIQIKQLNEDSDIPRSRQWEGKNATALGWV